MGYPKALLQAGVGGAVESRTMFDVLFNSVLSKYTTIQNSKKAPLFVSVRVCQKKPLTTPHDFRTPRSKRSIRETSCPASARVYTHRMR